MIESDLKNFRKRKIKKILIWSAVATAVIAITLTIIFISMSNPSIEQTNNQTDNG